MIIIDFETRGTHNVVEYGVDVHAPKLTEITLLTWNYPDQPFLIHTWYPGQPLPQELFDRIEAGEMLAAWNSRYDRKVWNEAAVRLHGFPTVPMERFVDLAVQGRASLLPASLDQASRALRIKQKPKTGQKAMKSYADAEQNGPSYDMGDPIFNAFVKYGIHDIRAAEIIRRRTRPLNEQEWIDFIISEDINDRGMAIDVEFCEAAANLFDAVKEDNQRECRRLTNNEIGNVTYHVAIARWVYDKLPGYMQDMMVKEYNEDGVPMRLSLDSTNVLPQLLDAIRTDDVVIDDKLTQFLELLEFARSNVAGKFDKMAKQQKGGRLCGAFVFGGAGQTGRFSSTGVQVHNFPRAKVKNEGQAMRDIIEGTMTVGQLRARYGPLNKVLAQLARPAIIAPEGRTLVWGDWSAIEARVLPWLADTKAAKETVLDVFSACDADPSLPDLYVQTASDIFGHDDITDKERQAGKVAVLALGFGGSVGAYRHMSRGYGMAVNDDMAKTIVTGWRDRNGWARSYWDLVWEAATKAIQNQGTPYSAGKVDYVFDRGLMGGTLLCYLPCGRPLAYPAARYAAELDEKTGKTRKQMTFNSGHARHHTWYGKLTENITQATAASLLRSALYALNGKAEVVMHTHDEIVCECDEDDADRVKGILEDVMTSGPEWAAGLPLSAEIKTNWYYTKNV